MKAFDIKDLPPIKEEVLIEYYRQRTVRKNEIEKLKSVLKDLVNDQKFLENKDNFIIIDSILPNNIAL